MSDPINPATAPVSPPPLPSQPADEAARAADASTAGAPTYAPVTTPAYDPATDPDDTGVPTALGGEFDDVSRGFFRALFDLSFRTFITRRLASVFYLVGLVAIAIGFIVYFVTGLVNAISLLFWNPGAGIALLVATLIIVPIVTFLAIVILRFVIEAVVALIAIAENTERTAENTRR
jgi:Domain of unknown function (DUF4282)